MKRTEALRRLEGTWNFELRDGRVRVRDVELLVAVEALRHEEERDDGRPGLRATTTSALIG